MNPKWIGFAMVAVLVVAAGFTSRLSFAQDQHKENETPLGKIMEKVQKHNKAITDGVRNAAAFKKRQKEVEKSALELAKLAKESKQHKEAYVKNAKDESEPQKRWDDIMDAFAKTSKELATATAKTDVSQKKAKELFQTVKKTCSDCHTVFRVEKEF